MQAPFTTKPAAFHDTGSVRGSVPSKRKRSPTLSIEPGNTSSAIGSVIWRMPLVSLPNRKAAGALSSIISTPTPDRDENER